MAKYTNSLTSHYGESSTSRADKMSGWVSGYKRLFKNVGSMNSYKKISNRKRRMFLKNKKNWNKI